MEKIPKSIRESFPLFESSNDNKVFPYPASDSEHYMGIAKSANEIRRFRLFFTDGRKISIPYATLPIAVLDSDGDLTLRTGGTEIIIKGRGLTLVEELFSEERVSWLRESDNSVDAFQTDIFIKSITVNGSAVM